MSREWLVHAALVDSFLDFADQQAISYNNVAMEQREFKPPADASMWYALSNLPAARDPYTLGRFGEDKYVGVFQIDVSGRQGQGVRQVLEAASKLTAHYTSGKSYFADNQHVRISKSQMSPARRDGVRLVISVSVYWSANIPREDVLVEEELFNSLLTNLGEPLTTNDGSPLVWSLSDAAILNSLLTNAGEQLTTNASEPLVWSL